MEFCPKCGKLLKPKQEGKEVFLVCSSCDYKKGSTEDYTQKEVKEVKEEEKEIVVNDDKLSLPETEIECPDCGNSKAYYWIEQTRAADEAPTRFYKCTKCGNTWREYG